MALNPIVRPLCLLFGFSGLIQSIIWITMAILSVLTYAEQLDWNLLVYDPATLSNSYYIRLHMQLLYFTDKQDLPTGFPSLLVDKYVILGFSILYLSFSAIWAVVSGALFYYSKFSKWPAVKTTLGCFIFLVVVISLADIALMAMLICDYVTMESSLTPFLPEYAPHYPLLVIGIMMSLAGRGFILLLLNLASIIYGIWFLCNYEDNTDPDRGRLYRVPIEAYCEHPGDPNFAEAYNRDNLRPPWLSPDGLSNDAFESEPPTPQPSTPYNRQNFFDRTPSARANKIDPPQWPKNNYNNSRNETNAEYAKPNKIPNPPKPIKVPPPAPPPKPSKKGPPVPFPDYTPPQSPKLLRSVIKQNSSYY